MIKNSIRYEKILEILFFLSLTLVFLDSYECIEFLIITFNSNYGTHIFLDIIFNIFIFEINIQLINFLNQHT